MPFNCHKDEWHHHRPLFESPLRGTNFFVSGDERSVLLNCSERCQYSLCLPPLHRQISHLPLSSSVESPTESSEQWWKCQITVESVEQEKHSPSHQTTGTYQVDPDTPHRYVTASKRFCFFSSTKVPSMAIMARRPPPDPRTTILGTLFWGVEDREHASFRAKA